MDAGSRRSRLRRGQGGCAGRAGTADPTGIRSTDTLPTLGDISYSPTGNLTGTQAADVLQAKLTKQADLADEANQATELENIQREKKVEEQMAKLK